MKFQKKIERFEIGWVFIFLKTELWNWFKYREKIEYFIDALRLLAYCRSRFLRKNTVIPPNKKNQRIPLKKAKLI